MGYYYSGSYGGRGWNASYGGPTYGSTNYPVQAGSGGAGSAGSGGGLICIQADLGTVRVDGTLNADGTTTASWCSGGGSGGGIFIACRSFAGVGTLQANGGGHGEYGGGGGGGRIAVWYNVPPGTMYDQIVRNDISIMPLVIVSTNPAVTQFQGAVSVAGGDSSGDPGTIVFLTVNCDKGAVFTFY